MVKIIPITPNFAVAGALQAGDFAQLAAAGFKSILSNLPEGESVAHLTAAEEARLAEQAGLGFRHVPATKHDALSERVVEEMSEALSALRAPVLAHCASGLRSAVAWAAAAVRGQPVDCVLARLSAAGFDLAGIRDQLQDEHDPGHVTPIPAALFADCASLRRPKV
ncbi:MAG: TIGR01244 family sulfur transferase [Hyphomicrobiaceae bacterium]